MSDRTADGVRMATSDVAAISLPDGRQVFLAIIVKDSRETSEQSAMLFKDVAQTVYLMLQKP